MVMIQTLAILGDRLASRRERQLLSYLKNKQFFNLLKFTTI